MSSATRLGWTVIAVLGLSAGAGPRPGAQEAAPLGFAFTNIAREAGLDAVTVFGGQRVNR